MSRTLRTCASLVTGTATLLVALGAPALAAPPSSGSTTPVVTTPPSTCDSLETSLDAVVTAGAALTGAVTVTNCSPLLTSYVLRATMTSVVEPTSGAAPCADGPSFATLVTLDPYASRTFVSSRTAPTCAGTYTVTVTTSLPTGQVVATGSADVTVSDPALVLL